MALAERVLLLLPSGGSIALIFTLFVEVVEDEVGLLEELDDVVPDDRFEGVCADARVVAGCAAPFRLVTRCRRAADGAPCWTV